MKQKLTNTWKHAIVGAIIAIIGSLIIYIFKIKELTWFLALAFTLTTIIWEINQWNPKRWLDTLIDILAGNTCFYLIYILLLNLLKII